MSKFRLFIISLLWILNLSSAISADIEALRQTGLPLLEITTVDGETPTCDYAFPPEGAFGISITNTNKVPGRVVLSQYGHVWYDSNEYTKNKSGMTIKVRGNTSSYYFNKKSYKIKLEKKADMLARNNSKHEDKTWVLIGDGAQSLSTMMGFKVNELVGMDFTPAYTFVNLVMNDDYLGVYMLTESVKRNEEARIDVDELSGYIIECDAYWWNEDLYFKSDLGKYFTFKYPESEDLTGMQLFYIERAIEKFEKSIEDGTYPSYIDVESFARWLIGHEILGTSDAAGSNMFISKYDNTDDTKISMTTMWDFDSAMKRSNQWAAVHEDSYFYYPYLFKSENQVFTETYKKMWREISDVVFDRLTEFISDFATSATGKALEEARVLDRKRWNTNTVTVNQNVNSWKTWLKNRKIWLDEKIEGINNTTDIQSIETEQERVINTDVYWLNGMKLPAERNNLPSEKNNLRQRIIKRDREGNKIMLKY